MANKEGSGDGMWIQAGSVPDSNFQIPIDCLSIQRRYFHVSYIDFIDYCSFDFHEVVTPF